MKKGKGILGAILGSLIGTVPWILLYVYGGMMVSLLAIVVALAASFGYKKLGGEIDKSTPIIIGIISVAMVIFSTLVIIPILLIIKEMGSFDFMYFEELYSNSEFVSAMIRDLIVAIIFTVLGIAGVIKNLKNEVENNKVASLNKEDTTEDIA